MTTRSTHTTLTGMNEHYGYTGRTRKHPQTFQSHGNLGLTRYCHMATVMLYLPYGNEERSNNDGRGASSTSQRARMEPLQADAKRERIPLRSKMDARRKIHSACYQARANYSRTSATETSQGQINKATCSWWQTIINTFTAVRLLLLVSRPRRSSPYMILPISNIRILPNKVKILCKRIWAHGKQVCS